MTKKLTVIDKNYLKDSQTTAENCQKLAIITKNSLITV